MSLLSESRDSEEAHRFPENDCREKYQANKLERLRKFSASWKKAFPWVKLRYNKMFCDVFLAYPTLCDKDSKFVRKSVDVQYQLIKSLQSHLVQILQRKSFRK